MSLEAAAGKGVLVEAGEMEAVTVAVYVEAERVVAE